MQPAPPSSQVRINPETGAILKPEEVAFCVEAASGTWVEVTNDDVLAASRDGLNGEIIHVIPLRLLFNGRLSPEKPYQLRPTQITKGKTKAADPAAINAYSLLLQGLAELRAAAIVRYSSRERVRYGALQPDGSFLALRFDEEIRQQMPLVKQEHSPESIKMMTQLLNTKFTEHPVLHDALAERINQLVSDRATAAGAGTPIVLQEVGAKRASGRNHRHCRPGRRSHAPRRTDGFSGQWLSSTSL